MHSKLIIDTLCDSNPPKKLGFLDRYLGEKSIFHDKIIGKFIFNKKSRTRNMIGLRHWSDHQIGEILRINKLNGKLKHDMLVKPNVCRKNKGKESKESIIIYCFSCMILFYDLLLHSNFYLARAHLQSVFFLLFDANLFQTVFSEKRLN